MAKVLNDPSIPDSCGVGVEYGIPQSSKRIDLLLSGRDETGRGNLLIVELKQWESARRTDMDGLVRTRFAEGEANTSHPSYQSWSYAELLRSFNETVDQEQVPLQPCAYLHNCQEGGDLLHPFYAHYVSLAPVFLGGDEERIKLRSFIARRNITMTLMALALLVGQGAIGLFLVTAWQGLTLAWHAWRTAWNGWLSPVRRA